MAARPAIHTGSALSEVADWYAAKTDDLLRRYGPGPRIHYHTGIVQPPVSLAGDAMQLRQRMLGAQVRLLDVAAEVWDAQETLVGEVLDVGCGLGGGAIYWAEQWGATVIAVTNVPEHATLVQGFVKTCGLDELISVRIGDACSPIRAGPFDAVVAIESSCYLPRRQWMQHVASILRPGGHLFVSDIFTDDASVKARFDSDWRTQIGSVSEYQSCARAAGFRLCSLHDLTAITRGFWELSIAHHRALLATGPIDAAAKAKAKAKSTIERHHRLLQGWSSGTLKCVLLDFRKSV